MARYTYIDGAQDQSIPSRFLSRLLCSAPSEDDVHNHVGLLVGQAILLVSLALVHIGYEAYTINLEAQVQTPRSRIVKESSRVVAEKGSQNQNVLGTETRAQQEAKKEEEAKKREAQLPKDEYFIAFTGDSMVETMGKELPILQAALREKYPETTFYLYNYAKGARNVSDNLKDFHESFDYKNRHYSSIDTLNPDIIVVGSSAYNVFSPHDINHHWLEYTRLVQEALTITPHVYMYAEPAPRRSGFGFGVDGIVWEPSTAWVHTGHIIEQLNNVLGLSTTLGVPVIDAYTPSLEPGTQQGRRELISTTDNIHLSDEGKVFVSKLMIETIDFKTVR